LAALTALTVVASVRKYYDLLEVSPDASEAELKKSLPKEGFTIAS